MSVEIVCPQCKHEFDRHAGSWECPACGFSVRLVNGKPVFTEIPAEINPSEKIERSAEQGSIWRQFNWRFIEQVSKDLPVGSDVLDVGAGRADFKQLFAQHAYLGLDVYPYPELDLAVDIIQTCPFREGSFDLVVLANVIEHVYEYRALVTRCAELLKPGGRLVLDIPDVGSPEFGAISVIEDYLGRPERFNMTIEEFEAELRPCWAIAKKEKVGPMLQYFLWSTR